MSRRLEREWENFVNHDLPRKEDVTEDKTAT
jgi:hypothetical protein